MSLALAPGGTVTTCVAVSVGSTAASGSASWPIAAAEGARPVAQYEVADARANSDDDQREKDDQNSGDHRALVGAIFRRAAVAWSR